MGRILAIDYGLKRTGIAVSDPMRLIATGLKTIHSNDLISFLREYLRNENVDVIVIGDPKNLDNSPSEISNAVIQIEKKVKSHFPNVEIEKVDERFTSKIAFQSIIDSGLKKKKRAKKALVDEVSATIILQSYMERLTL